MSGLQLTPAQRLPALLMAVTVVWAVIFAVAAFTGLAGRYRLHPDDPSRVPELPALDLSRAHSPLQLVEAYAVIGERPLFNSDRKPLPPEDEGKDDGAGSENAPATDSPLDVALTSVILTPQMRIAIVTDNRSGKSVSLKVGESLEGEQAGWRLQELQARKAVFVGSGGSSEVDLRVFDGTGGQAPTTGVAVAEKQGEGAPEGVTPANQPAPAAPAAASAPNTAQGMTPEQRAEMIRRRIEERRRQMREESERANNS